MATSSCPRPRRAGSEVDTASRRADGAAELRPLADEVLARERRVKVRAQAMRSERVFRLLVRAVYSLDRVAIEPNGPRFIETLHVRDMLPEFQAD